MRFFVLGTLFVSLSAAALPISAQPQEPGEVQIYSGGKEYGSIDEYREHQVEKLKSTVTVLPPSKSSQSSASNAPDISTEPLEEAVKAFTSQMLNYLAVDEDKLKEILKSLETNQITPLSGEGTIEEQLLKKIKELEGPKN